MFPSSYLAGILVHVEAGHVVLRHLLPHLGNDVLRQLGGQEGFAGAAGSREDDTAMLHQQVEVSLDDGLWNQRVKHQAVDAVLLHTWEEDGGWTQGRNTANYISFKLIYSSRLLVSTSAVILK